MRHIAPKLVLLAIALGLASYRAGATDAQASQTKVAIESMTVTQLEVAGDRARAQKDYDQAIKYFEAAVDRDPKNAGLYNKLGLAELKSGNLPAARSAFQRAAKRNSKFADALNNLGAVEYMERNFGAAAKQFKKAVALNEARATYHVNLGAAWFGQKKLDRAIAEYARALELDPEVLATDSKSGLTAQIASPEERAKYSYMLAKVYAKRGDAEQCLRCLKMAKEEGYRDLANVYKDEEFSNLRKDTRLTDIIPAPETK